MPVVKQIGDFDLIFSPDEDIYYWQRFEKDPETQAVLPDDVSQPFKTRNEAEKAMVDGTIKWFR
jgi:hypothetical protein